MHCGIFYSLSHSDVADDQFDLPSLVQMASLDPLVVSSVQKKRCVGKEPKMGSSKVLEVAA